MLTKTIQLINHREEHLKYRKLPFDCIFMKPILATKDYEFLCEYGAWMKALYNRDIFPITDAQRYFCEAIKQPIPPKGRYAHIFWRYLKRKELVTKGKLNNTKLLIKDDREDWKKNRKMRF